MTTLSRGSLAGLLLVSTALITGHAFAQAPIALGEVVVEADANGNETTVVRTTAGSKLAVSVTEVPQSVSVVGREQLDANPGAKATEVLRYTAGVSPSTYGTDADTDWMYIRGFQAEQTGVFMDNLPLFQYGFGTFLVDPFLLDRIEVLKGPSSALYGNANVGGLVNYVGKRPTGEKLLYTEAGINTFGNAYTGFDIGDSLGDSAAYRLTGKISGGGYQTDYSNDLRGEVLGSVKLSPTENTDLTLYAAYQNIDLTHTSTGFLPYVGTVVDAPGGVRIPRDLFYGEPDADTYERQQVMIGYELEHDINGDWTVRQNARYAHVSLFEDSVIANGLVGTQLNRYRFAHDTDVGTLSIDTQIEGKIQTGVVDHTVLVGFDYKNYNLDQTQASGGASPLDVLNPVYGSPVGALALPYINNEITISQAGLYAQDQMRFGDLIATVNGRYDWVTTDINDIRDPILSSSLDQGKFTGRVGLGYEFENGLTPYVSYSTSFNPVTDRSVTGAQYAAETGRQVEAGIKYEPTFMDGLITASVFNIVRDNVLQPTGVAGVSAPVGQVNLNGAELEAQVNFEDFKVIGALTYLEAEVLEQAGAVPVGNSPTQIPTLTASLAVEYTFSDGMFEGLTIGGGVRHLGESWADNANTLEVPSATVFDASIRYKKDDWGVTLAASNIFDTDYVASCQSPGSCGYGAGRAVTLSVNKSW